MREIDALIERLRNLESLEPDDELRVEAADALQELKFSHKQAVTNARTIELLMAEIAKLRERVKELEETHVDISEVLASEAKLENQLAKYREALKKIADFPIRDHNPAECTVNIARAALGEKE